MTAQNLPEAAKPRVFHHEGRRLFLIDGEPRVVDVDLATDLDREGGRYIRKLIKRHLVRLESKGKLLCFHEKGELGYGSPIGSEILPLLRQEGLIASTGVKPTIAFLNKRQAGWIVAKSDTDAADDLLEQLFDLYYAWEAGTLEPPKAQDALPPPADEPARGDRVAILKDGVAYQLDGGELKVVSTFLWDADRHWGSDAVVEAHRSQLMALGPLPVADGGRGVLLNRFHV
ncbi:hypothetical protein [Bosea sp. TND4EK4]|uniref:hypothetical protein n=1 Tax=Bosea sp. TND4EK4 TaxID=1907408 RepID=UPI000956B53E|nr:hypothetical protein [Bosea sp. TND4EK4]SIR35622.1 hypothetical protein SAMN05880592_11727 [Bosea sp. TND4EK4]